MINNSNTNENLIVDYDLDKTIRELSNSLANRKIEGVEVELDKAFKFVTDTNHRIGLGHILFIKGSLYTAKEQFKLAIKYYEEAMVIFKELHDSKCMIDTAYRLGNIQGDIGYIDDALKSYFYAIEKINEEGKYIATKASVTNNLGLIYQNMLDYENAIKFFLESYKLSKQQDKSFATPIITYNLACTCFFMNQFEASKEYIDLSLKASEDNESELDYLFGEIVDVVLTYRIEHNEENLVSRSEHIFSRIKSLGDLRDNVDLFKWYGKAMYCLGEFEKAKKTLEDIYIRLVDSELVSLLVEVGGFLEQIYVALGDFEAAYTMSKEVLLTKQNEISLSQSSMEEMLSGYDELENKGYVYNLQNTLRIFKLLSKVGEGITYNLDIKSMYEYIVDQIYDIWDLDIFGLGVKSDDNKYMEYYYHTHANGLKIGTRDLDSKNVLMNYCVLRKEEIIIQDTHLLKKYQNKFSKEMVKTIYEDTIRSIIFLPLHTDEGVIGGITIQSNNPEYFKKQDIEVLRILASYCSAAVINYKRHLKLNHLKDFDGLTGVYNRLALINRNSYLEENPQSIKGSIMIAMFDIDDFKPYNDNYGHLAGDNCLIEVASAVNAFVNLFDGSLYRYGGDEFVIVVEDMDQDKANQFLEDLMEIVRKLHILHEYHKSSNQVTLSVGAVVIETFNKTIEEYYHEIDILLYDVKNMGRDDYLLLTFNK